MGVAHQRRVQVRCPAHAKRVKIRGKNQRQSQMWTESVRERVSVRGWSLARNHLWRGARHAVVLQALGNVCGAGLRDPVVASVRRQWRTHHVIARVQRLPRQGHGQRGVSVRVRFRLRLSVSVRWQPLRQKYTLRVQNPPPSLPPFPRVSKTHCSRALRYAHIGPWREGCVRIHKVAASLRHGRKRRGRGPDIPCKAGLCSLRREVLFRMRRSEIWPLPLLPRSAVLYG